jgi:hypothetical protein
VLTTDSFSLISTFCPLRSICGAAPGLSAPLRGRRGPPHYSNAVVRIDMRSQGGKHFPLKAFHICHHRAVVAEQCAAQHTSVRVCVADPRKAQAGTERLRAAAECVMDTQRTRGRTLRSALLMVMARGYASAAGPVQQISTANAAVTIAARMAITARARMRMLMPLSVAYPLTLHNAAYGREANVSYSSGNHRRSHVRSVARSPPARPLKGPLRTA